MPDGALIHGSCVALGNCGVLILGPPGAGKSDLVLRLLDQPGYGISGPRREAVLVADDQVSLALRNGMIEASPPAPLAGKLEIRGLGIVTLPHRAAVTLSLAVRLVPRTEIERMPDPDTGFIELLGQALPVIPIDPGTASAPARIRAALDHLRLA